MKYVNLKFKSLPRICFAHHCKVSAITTQRLVDYNELTFVEKGEFRIKIKSLGIDRTVRDGEYFFAPAKTFFESIISADFTHSGVAFFSEEMPHICDENEIVFDKPDNRVLVEIENLFVPMFGKINEKSEELMRKVIAENKHVYKEYSNLRCAQSIIALLLSISYDAADAPDELVGNRYYVNRINDFLYANYADPTLDMQAVAAHFGRHPNYLSSVYKSVTQKTVMAALKDIRIAEAKRLLLWKKYFVKDIARMVGYPDGNYFSAVFKKETGMSPDVFCKRTDAFSGGGNF